MDHQSKILQDSRGFDPMIILDLLKKNWYLFVIGGIIGLFLARIYVSHTLPVYKTSATILINQTESRSSMDNTQILQGLGLPGGLENIENQIFILKSRDLARSTLQKLPFRVEWYFKTIRNKLPIYPATPFRLTSDTIIPLPQNTEFVIKVLNDSMFSLICESVYYPLQKTSSFGEIMEVPGGHVRLECIDEDWLDSNKERELYFVIHDTKTLEYIYSSRINVELLSKNGSILEVSMTGTNPAMDADFINMHLEGFQQISLDKKNMEAERRIQFIDNQLVGISDSLTSTENRLQQFRSANRVMNISSQGQTILQQITFLENEKARLSLEADYYDYLAEYLAKEKSGEIPIIPITMGITDPGLTSLVTQLADLQNQLSARKAGEMNPLQRNLEQQVRNSKDALYETLNGLRRANSLARSENQSQINKANAQASALPATERQLLGIERKFKLNDELYTFLLEMRAEQQMQKASNKADSEIVEWADEYFSAIISPDRAKVQFLGLFSGVGIPSLVVFLIFLFNNKLKVEDIKRMTDIPVVGNIPHSSEKTNTVALDFPNSNIAEAFRLLRSRMQFLTKDTGSPVILVTSSIPGEGKTFTAINLASVYSLLGKKTVLVGFDLRKPKLNKELNISMEKGLSTWLIGQDKWDDIIQKTSFENLMVISAGPVPPNPSELTALEKTSELIKLLKDRFEYIVIDSSPIGIVSDTYHLATLADTCLLVTRSGKTQRDMLAKTLIEINDSNINGVCMVINDIPLNSKHYSYGEKYGYTGDEGRSKRSIFRRKPVK